MHRNLDAGSRVLAYNPLCPARSARAAGAFLRAALLSWCAQKASSARDLAVCVGAAVVLASFSSVCRGQDAEVEPSQARLLGQAGAEQVDGLHPAVDAAGLYLNDSFEAIDALSKACGFARRRMWTKAAETLFEASENAKDKLVRISPGMYTGVRGHISDLVAGWPAEGLEAYRELVEDDLRAGLDKYGQSRRFEELLSLFERYFCTTGAAELADTIGQLAIESGNLTLAEHVYRRVLDRHPDAEQYQARYGVMLALLAAMQGAEPADAAGIDANAKIRWMGQDRVVNEVIPEIRRRFATAGIHNKPEDWPIFGGDETRNRPTATGVDEPGLLWRFHVADQEEPGDSEEHLDIFTTSDGSAARDLTVYPVVSDGFVYLQDYRGIVALHRNTGAVAWRFRADDHRVERDDYMDDEPPGWDSVTVHGGRVYAVLPGEEVMYYHYDPVPRSSELVCLDALTGRVRWRVSHTQPDASRSEVRFDSTPIVLHTHLYVVGRRNRSFGFEDCYLYRFNASDGSFEHRVHLGGASTATFGSRGASAAIIAAHGDTVYVCSGLGSLAAVSAHTGEVRWLQIYERYRGVQRNSSGRALRSINPWQFNPIIWSDARIVCLPIDGTSVLVASAKDGHLIRSIPVDQLGGMKTMYGVRGDLLCGVGHEAACYDFGSGSLRWSNPLPEDAEVFGRGVWAGDDLLVPTSIGLSRFRVADGQRTDLRWDEDGAGGNLLAMPDQLLVASGELVSAYVRKSEIWQTLRDRMAAAANDPLPALELAEVAFGAGEFAEALLVLEEAVTRADRQTTEDATLTQRLFDDVLKFARGLARRSALDAAGLDELFTFAGRYARNAESNVEYRFRFAELFERSQRPERALRLYQQVLRDRSLRELRMHPQTTGSKTAGMEARSRIAGLLDEHGRDGYAEFEAEASRWLRSARTTGDETLLRRLVDTFPNSTAAPRALVAHGDLLLATGRAAEAVRRFTAAYHRYPQLVDRPELMRRIADAFEQAGRPEHAYRWLTKAARDYPAATVNVSGRPLTFLRYRERLAAVRETVEPSRPNITLPLGRRSSRNFEEPAELLTPRFGDQPKSLWSRYYVATPAGIRSFDASTGREVWKEPAAVDAAPELLIARSDGTLFSTLYEVFALDPATGHLRWTHGECPKHVDDPGADWEEGGSIRTIALEGDRLVIARDKGEMTCIALDTGRVIWQQTHRPAPLGRMNLVDPWLIYHVVQDGRAVVVVIDAATGVWQSAVMTDEKRPVDEVFVTIDGRVVLVTSQSISCYDIAPSAGEPASSRRWRVSPEGSLRRGSLLLDLDAVYFAGSAGELHKIRVEDGNVEWRSERLIDRGDDDLVVRQEGASLIATTTSSITALDSTTGMTLWHGTTRDEPSFAARLLTESYVLAVDVGAGVLGGGGPSPARGTVAYFYDHRNASGVIPRDGGALDLGALQPIRTILAVDGAVLIQTDSTVHSFMRQ